MVFLRATLVWEDLRDDLSSSFVAVVSWPKTGPSLNFENVDFDLHRGRIEWDRYSGSWNVAVVVVVVVVVVVGTRTTGGGSFFGAVPMESIRVETLSSSL